MRVQEIMTRDVECVGPDCTLQEAASRMKALDVGPLPVCEKDRLLGMITDRDIAVRAVAEGHDPRTERVRDAMTRDITCCHEDQEIQEAARLMNSKQIRRLAVLNRDQRLVGIVSLADLAVGSGSEQWVGHTLEGISQPAMPRGIPVVEATPY
jgi:CBS domain-containing protein